MTTPNENELIFYTNKPLTATDYKTNWQKIIEWLTDGTYDFTVNSLDVTNSVTIGGSVTATGNVTAAYYYGDATYMSGLTIQGKNWLLNGTGQLPKLSDYSLVKDTYSTAGTTGIEAWAGMATGTAVNAGTFSNTSAANIGVNGYAIKFAGATITGTGIIYLRQRMQSKDAVNFINQYASFSCLVYHDVGSAINYTIYVRKADSTDDFSSTTQISASSATSVASATETELTLENISMAACGAGIEIELKVECGAITTKNFEFTNMQFELGTSSTDYDYRLYEHELKVGTTKVYVDGGGDSYIYEKSANVVDFKVGGSVIAELTTTSFGLEASVGFFIKSGQKIGLDGTAGGDTYIYESAANTIQIVAGGYILYYDGNFRPDGGGALSSGDGSNYWNDISYKTLTDRGCLGCFDDGVELQDGTIVSDTEALLAIKKHPTKKTVYGTDMLDYKTFPKVSYKKAQKTVKYNKLEELPRDANDEPIGGADGVEMTAMFSIMIGAIKELTNRVKELEGIKTTTTKTVAKAKTNKTKKGEYDV